VGDDIASDADTENNENEGVEKQPDNVPRLGREENEQKVSQTEEDNLEKEKTEKKPKNTLKSRVTVLMTPRKSLRSTRWTW
jgi:hypothetical protein